MWYRAGFIIILYFMAGCSGNNKNVNKNLPVSINKIWQFEKIDTAVTTAENFGAAWIGKNTLDLRNKDTLRLSYGNSLNSPTLFTYKIAHDTIFVQGKAGYKIIKLSPAELHLAPIFKSDSAGKKPGSVVLIYEAK